LANLGNLETAEENYEEARALLDRAATIRSELGDAGAIMLGLTYLQIGRVESLDSQDYSAAVSWFRKSEVLFNRQSAARNYLAE